MATAEIVVPTTDNLHPSLVSRRRSLDLDPILLYGTFSLLLFGPLAFGVVEAWAVWVLSIGAALLLALWSWKQIATECLRVTANPLFAPMLAFATIVSVQVVWRLSAYRYATESTALRYCIYAVFAFMASQFLRRTSQVRIIAGLLTGYGFALAVFAIIQNLSSAEKLYWLRTPQVGGWIYGPYVSHNHYAGLMEMLFPIGLVTALNRRIQRNWKWASGFAAAFMALTIFLSGSRGGMIAFLAQMVVLGTILARTKGRRGAGTVFAVLLVMAALLLWIGGEGLVARVASIRPDTRGELDNGVRGRIDADGLRMFAEKPILGWGLGTFPIVYPQFRSFYTNKFVNHAHNDYLQFLIETGLIGFAAALWFIITLYRSALKKTRDWDVNVNGAVALAALLGCTGILVHSFLDSNLQIPANAALFYVLAALATAETHFGSHRKFRHRGKSTAPGWTADAPSAASAATPGN